MSCITPVLINNPNTGYPLKVPCRNCVNCKRSASVTWQFRLRQEIAKYQRLGCQSTFYTLTYRDEFLPDNSSLRKKDLVKFIKRLRYYSPQSFTHYSVGEYGDNGLRSHYHGIIFGLSPESFRFYAKKAWNFGFITQDIATAGRIRYIVDYITYEQRDKRTQEAYLNGNLEPPFAIFSKGLGINDETLSYALNHSGYCINKNSKTLLPKYYRDKYSIENVEPKKPRDFEKENMQRKASFLQEISNSNLQQKPVNRLLNIFSGGHQR